MHFNIPGNVMVEENNSIFKSNIDFIPTSLIENKLKKKKQPLETKQNYVTYLRVQAWYC